jgi:diguanylate cyclase (GGDEF)-like protein
VSAPPVDKRLRVLQETGLLDSLPEAAFDRLTRLAAHVMGAPTALVTLVDAHRQFFKSALGLDEPWASQRETPLSYSFCKYVTADRAPLIVSDARDDRRLRGSPGVTELGAVAYAGIPLLVQGEAVGAFCVVDNRPRHWPKDQLHLLEDLAASVVSEIELRLALRAAREQRALTEAIVESLGDACMAVDSQRNFVVVNQAARRIFAAEPGQPLPADWASSHRSFRPDGSALPSEEGALGRALHGQDTNGLTFSLQKPGAEASVWVEASGRPVRGADGKVVAGVAVYRDVTESKRATDLYKAVASNIPNAAVALFDRDLRCLTVDGALPRAQGLPVEKMVGASLRALAGFAPESAAHDHVDQLYRRALAGETGSADLTVGERTLTLHAAPVQGQSGVIDSGIVLAFDVTKQRGLETALRQSEQIYRAIVQHLPRCAVLMVDRDMRYVSADGPLLPEILQRTDLPTLRGTFVADVVSPQNRDRVIGAYQRAFAGEPQRRDIELGGRCYEMSTVPIYDGDVINHIMVFSFDVTERRREVQEVERTRDALAREQALLGTMLAHIDDGVALLDANRHVILANEALAAMMDLPKERVIGLPPEGFLAQVVTLLEDPDAFRAEFAETGNRPRHREYTFARPRRRILRRAWTPVRLIEGDGFLVTWHDVTAERDLLEEREKQLLVDALTGIPNRRAADEALRMEHERKKRTGSPMSVALFDIDHFKQVNDRHGHAVGDAVLQLVGPTLEGQGRLTDTIARWGGEEFVAILNVPLDGARAFCERARQSIEKLACPPVERITISVGIAELAPGESTASALERADGHLYQAKAAGRNRVRG